MNETATQTIGKEVLDQKRIPMNVFLTNLSQVDHFPYQRQFSLRPLLKHLRARQDMTHNSLSHIQEQVIETFEEFERRIQNEEIELESCELASLFEIFFHDHLPSEPIGFVGLPFSKQFIYKTDGLEKLYLTEIHDLILPEDPPMDWKKMSIIMAGMSILNRYFDVPMEVDMGEVFTIENTTNGLKRYFRVKTISSFVNIKRIDSNHKLSSRQISELLNDYQNIDLWLEYLPPENYVFEGVMFGFFEDVSEAETISLLKQKLLEREQVDGKEIMSSVQDLLRTYLNMPDLTLGIVPVKDMNYQGNPMENSLLMLCCQDLLDKHPIQQKDSVYAKVAETNEPMVSEDLLEEPITTQIEDRLIKQGFRGLILTPVNNNAGELSCMFEIGTPHANQLNAFTLLKLKGIISLLTVGYNRFQRNIEDQINLYINQQFTSIHPSVKWRFRDSAMKTLMGPQGEQRSASEPIIFQDVYPLYGQADIVHSSSTRNKAIQVDLLENLEQVADLLKHCLAWVPFQLLDAYLNKVEQFHQRISKEYLSSDESLVLELLVEDIHPFLLELKEQYPEQMAQRINQYFNLLDDHLQIIYKKRKDYEDSVEKLNYAISSFMDKEERKMQQLLPHYYEMYKTDGVEYNIYLGESLLENNGFSTYQLKNFRLWQLKHMCDITRLVAKEGSKLKVPLTTAQLIFVYNVPLSIRFREEEKKFDVDGAYNVRYEILKKRIDKAVIDGTGERLTQSGKIAIPFLQERDKQEYMSYLEYLRDRGEIEEEIEDVTLAPMMGAHGLRALRVTVANVEE